MSDVVRHKGAPEGDGVRRDEYLTLLERILPRTHSSSPLNPLHNSLAVRLRARVSQSLGGCAAPERRG